MATSHCTIEIIIRTANNRYADFTIDISPLATVRDLKNRITIDHPSKPVPKNQRLIYSGKLLEDHSQLQLVFTKSNVGSTVMIHLVLDSDKNEPAPKIFPQATGRTVLTSGDAPSASLHSSLYDQYINELARYQQQLHQFVSNPYGHLSSSNSEPSVYLQYCYTHHQMLQTNLAYHRPTPTVGARPVPSTTTDPPTTTPPAPARPAANNNELDQANDLLGTLHIIVEVFLLCSIVYFYSTFNRFLFVFAILALLYLYCRGSLTVQRDQRAQVPPVGEQAAGNHVEEENVGRVVNGAHVQNDEPNVDDIQLEEVRMDSEESLGQTLSRKKYHLLGNSVLAIDHRQRLSTIIHEISLTLGLSLFAFYLFYQAFGNVVFIFVLIFGILMSLYRLQDMLLYQPNEPDTARTIVQTPELFHMQYETVTIETSDKEKLHGYLLTQMRQTNECATLVFFHGNAGNIGHRLQNAHLLYRACNINILLFDYRGYGKSTGTPSEAGLYTDAQSVYDFVRARTDLNQEKIFLFGRSLGGAVALHLAAHLAESEATPPLHCVILENTFTSIPDMAKRLFQVFILDYVPGCYYKNMFSSISKIRHIKVPVLFLSGEQDELVPPQMMQKLHEECQSAKKKLILFFDGQHNTTWLSQNYTNQIRNFLSECSTSSETTSTSASFN